MSSSWILLFLITGILGTLFSIYFLLDAIVTELGDGRKTWMFWNIQEKIKTIFWLFVATIACITFTTYMANRAVKNSDFYQEVLKITESDKTILKIKEEAGDVNTPDGWIVYNTIFQYYDKESEEIKIVPGIVRCKINEKEYHKFSSCETLY